jgi:hypothetical protein
MGSPTAQFWSTGGGATTAEAVNRTQEELVGWQHPVAYEIRNLTVAEQKLQDYQGDNQWHLLELLAVVYVQQSCVDGREVLPLGLWGQAACRVCVMLGPAEPD